MMMTAQLLVLNMTQMMNQCNHQVLKNNIDKFRFAYLDLLVFYVSHMMSTNNKLWLYYYGYLILELVSVRYNKIQ
jgi:hypothetical protein